MTHRCHRGARLGLLAGTACLSILLPARAAGSLDLDVSYAEAHKLLFAQGNAGDEFGWSSDLDGDTLIVGAWFDDDLGSESGSATLYERDPTGNWIESALLLAPDGEISDYFGSGVAISGDWAVVGARGDDDLGSSAGAAYVFERDAGGPRNWGFLVKLLASDGDSSDIFGETVALSNDTAIIGAPGDDDLGASSGSAYIFQRDRGGPSNWGQVTKLTAVDGGTGDDFSNALGISGDQAVIGAPDDDDLGTNAGAAYLYERNSGGADNWGLVTKLLATDGFDGDSLGDAAAISGDTVIVGASRADAPDPDAGAAYLFERDAGGPNNWGQVAKLTAIDGETSDIFGDAVAIDGDTLAVGATRDDDRGSSSGSAYVFQRDEGGIEAWGKIAKIIVSDGSVSDGLGSSLALDDGVLAISAVDDDDLGTSSGSVYIFEEIVVDPALVITGDCPGDVTFNFGGGTPLGQAALAFSQAAGSAVIPGGLCTGTGTGLDVINVLGILPIDAEGRITLGATLPPFVCALQMQALDLVSCATSNVTEPP